MLGTADYNPGDEDYDPNERKISTFAEVKNTAFKRETPRFETVLIHRSRAEEEVFIEKSGAIRSSNSTNYERRKNGVKISERRQIADIRIVGNAVVFPMNLGLGLRNNRESAPLTEQQRHAKTPSAISAIIKITVGEKEFICSECFLVKQRSQLAYMADGDLVCAECV